MDLAPREGALANRQWQAGRFGSIPDVDVDFDRKRRTTATFGAYAADTPAAPDRFHP